MRIDRRTAVGLMGLGVLDQHFNSMRADPNSYELCFFSARENLLLDHLAEMILPADSHSPGAHEARVTFHIDLVASHSGEDRKLAWRNRLAAFDAMARDRFGRPFLELATDVQCRMLDLLAASEASPPDEASRFFVDVKRATLFAYYSSQVGLLRELGYAGNKAVAEFGGCPDSGQPRV